MTWKTIVKVVLVLTAFILIINTYKDQVVIYEQQINELQTQITSMEHSTEEMESKLSYVAAKEEQFDGLENINGYTDWKQIDRLAKYFYDDSNEKFKKEWGLFLVNEALRYEIDPYIVYELLKVETGGTFNPELIGPETKYGHAYGLAQFMKNTAPWIANMAGIPYKEELLFDPYYSIQLSIVYLDFLYDRYGNWNKALTAYHRGMGGLQQYIRKNGHAKSWYAKKILSNSEEQKTLIAINQ